MPTTVETSTVVDTEVTVQTQVEVLTPVAVETTRAVTLSSNFTSINAGQPNAGYLLDNELVDVRFTAPSNVVNRKDGYLGVKNPSLDPGETLRIEFLDANGAAINVQDLRLSFTTHGSGAQVFTWVGSAGGAVTQETITGSKALVLEGSYSWIAITGVSGSFSLALDYSSVPLIVETTTVIDLPTTVATTTVVDTQTTVPTTVETTTVVDTQTSLRPAARWVTPAHSILAEVTSCNFPTMRSTG